MAMAKTPNGMEETTEDTIGKETTTLDLKYDNIIGQTIAFGFDEAFSLVRNEGNMRKKFSETTNREVLYIHCKGNTLSLDTASCKNKNQMIKKIFHVLKGILQAVQKDV